MERYRPESPLWGIDLPELYRSGVESQGPSCICSRKAAGHLLHLAGPRRDSLAIDHK